MLGRGKIDRFSGMPQGADVHGVAEPQTSRDVRRPRDDSLPTAVAARRDRDIAMEESFEESLGTQAPANRAAGSGHRSMRVAPLALTYVDVLEESDYEAQVDRTHLAAGLSQITSRLLEQLTSGGGRTRRGDISAADVQRDSHGSRVPLDGSPGVAFSRVIVVSPGSKMLALVSLPVSAHAQEKL